MVWGKLVRGGSRLASSCGANVNLKIVASIESIRTRIRLTLMDRKGFQSLGSI